MTRINTGGPAFPSDCIFENGVVAKKPFEGMTLRDYAAIHDEGMHEDAHADYAATFNRDPKPETGDYLGWAKWFAKADARLRYIKADAMIAARNEGDKP